MAKNNSGTTHSKYARFVPQGVSPELFTGIVDLCGDGPEFVAGEIQEIAETYNVTLQEASWLDALGWSAVVGEGNLNDMLLRDGTNIQKVKALRDRLAGREDSVPSAS